MAAIGPVPRPAAAAQSRDVLAGRIEPARAGARVALERLAGDRWVLAARSRLRGGGRYRFVVRLGGAYRVRWRGLAGPVVNYPV